MAPATCVMVVPNAPVRRAKELRLPGTVSGKLVLLERVEELASKRAGIRQLSRCTADKCVADGLLVRGVVVDGVLPNGVAVPPDKVARVGLPHRGDNIEAGGLRGGLVRELVHVVADMAVYKCKCDVETFLCEI